MLHLEIWELDPAVRASTFPSDKMELPLPAMCVIPFRWLGGKRLHNSVNGLHNGTGPGLYNSEFVTTSPGSEFASSMRKDRRVLSVQKIVVDEHNA